MGKDWNDATDASEEVLSRLLQEGAIGNPLDLGWFCPAARVDYTDLDAAEEAIDLLEQAGLQEWELVQKDGEWYLLFLAGA